MMLFCHWMLYASNAYDQLVTVFFYDRNMLFLCRIRRVGNQFSHLLATAHYWNATVLYKSYDVLTMFTNKKSHVSYLLENDLYDLHAGPSHLPAAGLPDCRIAPLCSLCSRPHNYFTFLVYLNYTRTPHKVKHFLIIF